MSFVEEEESVEENGVENYWQRLPRDRKSGQLVSVRVCTGTLEKNRKVVSPMDIQNLEAGREQRNWGSHELLRGTK